MVKAEHHCRQMTDALKAGKAPPGLTPRLNLTAMEQTDTLIRNVDRVIQDAGLKIVDLLQDHYKQLGAKLKSKAEDSRTKFERVLREYKGSNKDELKARIQKAIDDAQVSAMKAATELTNKRNKRKCPLEEATGTEEPPDQQLPPTKKAAPTEAERDESILNRLYQLLKKDQVHQYPNIPINTIIPNQPTPTTDSSPQREPEGRRLQTRPRKGKGKQIRKKLHKKAYRLKRTLTRKLTNRHKASDNIINLSYYQLSNAETAVLSKGLSFIPKPKNIDKKRYTSRPEQTKDSANY